MPPRRDSRGRFTSGGGGGGRRDKAGRLRDESGKFLAEQRQQITGELERFVSKIVIAITLNVVANLVAAPSEGGTPVDTGWARANWVPAIGKPASDVTGSRDQVSTAAQQAGESIVLGYRLAMGPVYISNNVPYILALNDGHSPQAEPHFIERAIDKAVLEDLRRLAA